MTAAALALLTLAIVVAAVLWWVDRRGADKTLQGRLRRDVVVTCKTGPTFTGVLYESDDTSLILRDAEALGPTSQTPVDGELLVRWVDVAYVQYP